MAEDRGDGAPGGPALPRAWWVDGVCDIAGGLATKLTAIFLLVAFSIGQVPDWKTLVLPFVLFLAGAFYSGRGVRRLRRAAKEVRA